MRIILLNDFFSIKSHGFVWRLYNSLWSIVGFELKTIPVYFTLLYTIIKYYSIIFYYRFFSFFLGNDIPIIWLVTCNLKTFKLKLTFSLLQLDRKISLCSLRRSFVIDKSVIYFSTPEINIKYSSGMGTWYNYINLSVRHCVLTYEISRRLFFRLCNK